MPPINILLIDQHTAFLASAVAFLRLHLELKMVATAHNGETGLRTAFELQPDLILVGLELYDFAGLGIIRQLRASLPTAAIIALSLNGHDSHQQEALLAGADGFASKARILEDLLVTIQRVGQARGLL